MALRLLALAMLASPLAASEIAYSRPGCDGGALKEYLVAQGRVVDSLSCKGDACVVALPDSDKAGIDADVAAMPCVNAKAKLLTQRDELDGYLVKLAAEQDLTAAELRRFLRLIARLAIGGKDNP